MDIEEEERQLLFIIKEYASLLIQTVLKLEANKIQATPILPIIVEENDNNTADESNMDSAETNVDEGFCSDKCECDCDCDNYDVN